MHVQPESGTALTYRYDAFHRLSEIQVGSTENAYTYSYTGVNPLVQQVTRPNGSVTTYQYNALTQLTEILNRASNGEVLSRHTYAYNDQDLRASETREGAAILPEPAVDETKTAYTYNEANQLLTTTDPDAAYTYDADGNLTQGDTKDGYVFIARYDAENRMTSLEYTDSSDIAHRQEFRYSGNGLLAEQKVYENGVLIDTVRIVRDGMMAIQDRDGNNAVLREYTWGLNLGGGIGGLLNLKQGGQNYAYLYDGKGNVEALLDTTESVVAAYRYDPFGVLLAKTGSFEQPYGFSTKRYNAPVGMVQYEFRNYFPDVARWDRRDPLGEAGGLNLYAFVGNNPVNWMDPWGLEFISKEEGWKIIKAAEEFLGTPFSELQCSALVHKAYINAGFPYPMTPTSSFTKQSAFKLVNTPQVGDVVFFGSHMGLYNPNPPESRDYYVVLSATRERGVAYGPLSWFEMLLDADEEIQYFRYDKQDNEPCQ